MRMKLVTAVRQTGHSGSCVSCLQAEHSTRWPQGIAANVAASAMQIWHSGSVLGADGALCSSCWIKVETGVRGAGEAETRWQLRL
jgi:hypothetical protein